LETKQLRHDLLLAAYNIGDVLQQLQPQQCSLLFQHAEMLAAVLAVLDWQRAIEAAAAAADGTGEHQGGNVTHVMGHSNNGWHCQNCFL
jgi:hypothetical protein